MGFKRGKKMVTGSKKAGVGQGWGAEWKIPKAILSTS